MRFYIGELCTKTIWGMDNRENMHAIRTAQEAVADPLVDYIPTFHDAVEIGGEAGLHYHYGTLGQLEHGVNYADAYHCDELIQNGDLTDQSELDRFGQVTTANLTPRANGGVAPGSRR